MAPEEICELLRSRFGKAIEEAALEGGHPYVQVAAGEWGEVALFLRDDPQLGFNFLRSISSLDLMDDGKLACVYDLNRIPTDTGTELITETHEVAVRIVTERDDGRIPSVAHIWPTADWHEREAFDLMGIRFDGHPDLRRILCPEDWVGHPLRKDYEFPLEYHGIPCTTEYEQTNPRH